MCVCVCVCVCFESICFKCTYMCIYACASLHLHIFICISIDS